MTDIARESPVCGALRSRPGSEAVARTRFHHQKLT